MTADGLRGGRLTVDSALSSQFLSGLLMAAPLTRDGLTIEVRDLVSGPYVDMTVALLRRFGARVHREPDRGGDTITVEPGPCSAIDVTIEPDASTASYLFAAAAVTGRGVTVPGLGRDSLQGDLRFVEILARTGARVEVGAGATTVTGEGPLRGGFSAAMGDISDTFPGFHAEIARLFPAGVPRTGRSDRTDQKELP